MKTTLARAFKLSSRQFTLTTLKSRYYNNFCRKDKNFLHLISYVLDIRKQSCILFDSGGWVKSWLFTNNMCRISTGFSLIFFSELMNIQMAYLLSIYRFFFFISQEKKTHIAEDNQKIVDVRSDLKDTIVHVLNGITVVII